MQSNHNQIFKGTGVALVTPFLSNHSIDFDALTKLIDYVIQNGVNYIVSLGTTGETPTLSAEEKLQVLNHTIDITNNRVPIVAGIGGNNTQEIIETISIYPTSKIDGILSVSPYYNKPMQEGIYQHFKAIANCTPLPIILYNVPGRTGSNMLPETVLRLATDCANIVAIKEASGNIAQNMEMVRILPENFLVLSGDDDLALPQIACGLGGVISVAANCFPQAFTTMINHALNHNFVEARKIHYSLLPAINLLFAEGNPPGVKNVLNQLGIIGPTLRLPVVPITTPLAAKITDFLRANKYI